MEADLRGAWYGALSQFATDQNLPIAWPSRPFEPENHDVYLRAATLMTEPQVLTVCGGGSRYRWLLQAAVYYRDGVGEIAPLRIADSLRDEFPFAFRLAGAEHDYTVTAPAFIASPVEADGWYFIPVQIRVDTIK